MIYNFGIFILNNRMNLSFSSLECMNHEPCFKKNEFQILMRSKIDNQAIPQLAIQVPQTNKVGENKNKILKSDCLTTTQF